MLLLSLFNYSDFFVNQLIISFKGQEIISPLDGETLPKVGKSPISGKRWHGDGKTLRFFGILA
jgi:hypothetical protein